MIIYVKMNIFESPAQVIVNTVNTVGVMGKGLAKQYKTIYPDMFKEYQKYCEQKLLDIGKLWIYKTDNKWILNFPTKKHWRQPSKLEYIEAGLKKFVDTYEEKGIRSISFPQLGCGNGGLNWENEVKPLMEKYLKSLDIDIFIHLPIEKDDKIKPEHQNVKEIKKWLQSEPKSLSFYEVWEDLERIITDEPRISISGVECILSIEYSKKLEDYVINIYSVHNEKYNQQITIAELFEGWNLLRQNGMLTEKMLSSHLSKIKKSLFSLLLLLPYVDLVLTVTTQNDTVINQEALRLKPLRENHSFQGELQL